MDASSLEELSSHFEEKLSRLTGTLAIEDSLSHADEDVRAESQRSMELLWSELDDLSVILTLMRTHMAEQKQTLGGVQELKTKLATLLEGLQHAHSNLPSHLPAVQMAPAPTPNTAGSTAAPVSIEPKTECTVKPTPKPPRVQEKCVSSMMPTPGKSASSPCPLMEYLTVDEFSNVPKYMKGRLSYLNVNTFIDEVNKTFRAKYKLLRQKKSSLSDINRKRYETLKMQESKDTAGAYFVTEADFKEWSSIKMSKENRSIMTVLRHCGRMYEIRSGGLVRYAMVDLY